MANNKSVFINDDCEYCLNINNEDENYLIYLRSKTINIHYQISNAHANIIFVNDTNKDVLINDSGQITDNSEVKMMFIDLIKHNYSQDSRIDVLNGSSLKVVTKFLTYTQRKVKMFYQNVNQHTQIGIDNSCVCLDDSLLNFECIGKVAKGAKHSVNKQASRCLTIDHPSQALVKPVLLIDENDVEAAHALSSGTIDQDVLYYLNSRGISYQAAMNLIIHSYLLPKFEEIEMFGEEAHKLIENLSKKVV